MPGPTPQELKKLLLSEGFEVYRTMGDRVILADRVRDNLIMDSGVSAVSVGDGLAVRFVVRAQAVDFPGESPDSLFTHARRTAGDAEGRGYAELTATVVPIHDPGDRERVLDTWYEVSYQREVADEAELVAELRAAFAWPKVATRGTP
jgi:hypothetical protein